MHPFACGSKRAIETGVPIELPDISSQCLKCCEKLARSAYPDSSSDQIVDVFSKLSIRVSRL